MAEKREKKIDRIACKGFSSDAEMGVFLCFMFNFRYIDQFSRCLYVEYKKSGIDVQCQVCLLMFLTCSTYFMFLY